MAAVQPPPSKRRRTHGEGGHSGAVIEGLPDHVAEICLSLVDRPSLIAAVCSRWRRLLYSPSFPAFLSMYVVFVDPDPGPGRVRVMSFDPVSSRWDTLPPPPPEAGSLIRRHQSFISLDFPIQSVSVAGKLVLLAGSTRELSPALSHPVVFDPVSSTWTPGPTMEYPRRWCAAGAHGDAVYVASGMGSQFSPDMARSAEKWAISGDAVRRHEWEKLKDLKDGRFSREAIDAVGWRGKLLMVNVRGDAVKEGAIYDVVKDTWQAMPADMLAGWKGPVAAMAPDETLYAVDETRGTVAKYDEERREWGEVVAEEERLKGAYQIAAVAGKLCVVAGGGGGGRRIVVVDVAAAPAPAKVWSVECPEGLEPVAVHVLPRASRPEFR
ncbi:PREDICTED: F-box/kelch-repeat protein SKIP25 [Tarenaya hassleriana]|uniref:F-box/kelch-repeat protein SKIP25 n=1 Tax=Tarenaya hassleriana TaxID=28532 RepID=UPI00053C7674|nr:PREDICTED: F-box/kelch-repeat protein SKIP25 [Tarenaya hassleriana]